MREGRNLQAREEMLQAATMACLALANAIAAAPVHNCSHALGALYHIPHGRAKPSSSASGAVRTATASTLCGPPVEPKSRREQTPRAGVPGG